MKIKEWFERLRRKTLTFGYTCDNCGAELFDYPAHRFCATCEGKLLSPKRSCPKCGRETIADGVCLTCKSRAPKFTQGISPFSYKGDTALCINKMKNGEPRLAAYLGEKMADAFLENYAGAEEKEWLIIPVPLTADRKKIRGYNQAELLAESAQNRLRERGVSSVLNNEALEKKRETGLQKEKGAKERAESIQGAYHLHLRLVCKDRYILLIDDIQTTGATGSECAGKLLNAGAKEVIFLTAAALPERK